MRGSWLGLLGVLLLASPALAQGEAEGTDTAPGPQWTMSLGAGTSGSQGTFDQNSYSLDLNRSMANGYVSLAVSRLVDEGQAGVPLAVPNHTDQLSIGGGYSFGALSVDLSASYGWLTYDARRLRSQSGVIIDTTGKGTSWSIGGSATLSVPLGERTRLMPGVSLDYGRSTTARVALPQNGAAFISTSREAGITGGVNLALSRDFGEEGEHALTLSYGLSTTSNANANAGNFTRRGRRTPTIRPRPGSSAKETWSDIGINVNFAMRGTMGLSLGASRTIGMTGAQSTSVSAGLSVRF